MTRAARARLFVAVDPPAEVREALADWGRGALAGWSARAGGRPAPQPRVLEPHALHLTLCFLGARPVEEIEPLARALHDREEHVGELALGAPLWLPPRGPRLLAVEVRENRGELAALQAAVSRALSLASSWEPERRRFRPHITVARMRGERGRRRRAAPELPPLAPTPQRSFTPGALVLYRSHPGAGGSTYEPLAYAELSSAPG